MQALLSLQLSAVPPVQTPPAQVSAPLQTFESAHELPFVSGRFEQPVDGKQLSIVHGLPSLQLGAEPGVQVPL